MEKILLTLLLIFSVLRVGSSQICNIYCDGRNDSLAVDTRIPVTTELFSRQIKLYISDEDNMGFAEISNGDPNDQIWLDRSMDGGVSYEGILGLQITPNSSRSARTNMFNVDNPSDRKLGALRACGKANGRDETVCTGWARSTVNAETPVDAGATAMMQFFNNTLWLTTGWWNSANCLTAMVDYFKWTGNRNYFYVIEQVFEGNQQTEDSVNFTNKYIDDTLWWGLAWVGAYDLTGDEKYIQMAQIDSDYSYEYRDNVCGGGLWWSTDKDYKNAIPNELFIKLAAALHNRLSGDTKYLAQAIEVWNWFNSSGMINSDNLINDGLTDDCKNNEQATWTYNQGVILGALVELHKATNESKYIEKAKAIVDAVLSSPEMNMDGILYEFECNGGDCGGDVPSFKGVFVRNLGELDRYLEGRPYKSWLETQASTIWEKNKNSLNQFGTYYAGPFNKANAANHHSAFEALVAAV